jgi:hypothetical protein
MDDFIDSSILKPAFYLPQEDWLMPGVGKQPYRQWLKGSARLARVWYDWW